MEERIEISSVRLAEYAKQNHLTVITENHGSATRYEQYPEILDKWVRENSEDCLTLEDKDGNRFKVYSLNRGGKVTWYNSTNEPKKLFGG